jgi:hypothetical protein
MRHIREVSTVKTLTALVLLGLVAVQAARQTGKPLPHQPPQAEKVKLFLGPVPASSGFINNTNRAFQDSYRDIEKAYRENEPFHNTVTLVQTATEAELVLEVTSRKENVWTGNTLTAKLSVVGSEYATELDGSAGLTRRGFQNMAKNLLRETVDWLKANREAFDKARAARVTKEP